VDQAQGGRPGRRTESGLLKPESPQLPSHLADCQKEGGTVDTRILEQWKELGFLVLDVLPYVIHQQRPLCFVGRIEQIRERQASHHRLETAVVRRELAKHGLHEQLTVSRPGEGWVNELAFQRGMPQKRANSLVAQSQALEARRARPGKVR
jgi:hypothetical protein